jgi:hypothetical protein
MDGQKSRFAGVFPPSQRGSGHGPSGIRSDLVSAWIEVYQCPPPLAETKGGQDMPRGKPEQAEQIIPKLREGGGDFDATVFSRDMLPLFLAALGRLLRWKRAGRGFSGHCCRRFLQP